MYSETIAEFLSLLNETREQVAYFKELGVKNLESGSSLSETLGTTLPATEPMLRESVRSQPGLSTSAAQAGVTGKNAAILRDF